MYWLDRVEHLVFQHRLTLSFLFYKNNIRTYVCFCQLFFRTCVCLFVL
nr:MAG TPA: hypothetical protein [Caudoviricetes sp.]